MEAEGGWSGVERMRRDLFRGLTEATDRPHASRELAQKAAVLSAIIASANEAITVCDETGRNVYANAAAREILRIWLDDASMEEWHATVEVRRPDRVTPVPIEEIPLVRALAGESVRDFRVCLRHRNTPPEGVLIESSAAPVVGADGSRIGAVVVCRDIEEKDRLQRQLAQAQKLEALGQLAAGIAHEINTPAQFVNDNASFLEDAFADIADLMKRYRALAAAVESGPVPPGLLLEIDTAAREADLDHLLEEIPAAISQSQEGIQRVTRIVRAMKDVSHPGSARKEPADLNEAVRSTLLVAANEWKYVAEIALELDEALPLVSCLVHDLKQVLLNLLVNAAHAIGAAAQGAVPSAPSAGVHASGEARTGRTVSRDTKGTITIRTRREGTAAVVIEVADSGPGVPDEIRERVFDPFFTTKPVGRGTGQGLAIAQKIVVEKHGGSIELESEPGRGATFRIRLPLEDDGSDRGWDPVSVEEVS